MLFRFGKSSVLKPSAVLNVNLMFSIYVLNIKLGFCNKSIKLLQIISSFCVFVAGSNSSKP